MKRNRLTRTSIAIPESLKKQMSKLDVNWSLVAREAIARRLEEEGSNLAEAIILNERLRRKAPQDWDSTVVIRKWRSSR